MYVNLANYVFKPSVEVDNRKILLDPLFKFNLPLNQDLSLYLLTPEETHDHFIRVFEEVISLKTVEKEERIEMCKIFQEFILLVLKNLKRCLPFDDDVLSRILACDPTFSTQEDWEILAKRFPNVIPPEMFHIVHDEASSWMMDQEYLQKKKGKSILEKKALKPSAFTMIEKSPRVIVY